MACFFLKIPFLVALAVLLASLPIASLQKENDALDSYRDFSKNGWSPVPRSLTHYREADELIKKKLALELSQKERAILTGLHWLIGYFDIDENFDYVSSSFLLLLHELTRSKGRKHQQEVASFILKKSLA